MGIQSCLKDAQDNEAYFINTSSVKVGATGGRPYWSGTGRPAGRPYGLKGYTPAIQWRRTYEMDI